jgi:HSP20 family protein
MRLRRMEESTVADIMLRSPFAELRRLMHEAWDEDRRPAWTFTRLADLSRGKEGTLALDVEEEEGRYRVTASVPGFKRDEIKVHVNDGALTIAAERSEERQEKRPNLVRHERYSGSLIRRVAIPGITAQSEVEARLNEGVLTVEMSAPGAERTRRIEVKEA